ncbi:hypothetical protein HY990_02720 [Candidatus Micrarchaeota archaeon]|nr:hypothetical protein [Candidatus Micrarchaeota archaeon]
MKQIRVSSDRRKIVNQMLPAAMSFASSLMVSEPAIAQTRTRGFVGLFDHGQEVDVGVGISRRFDLGRTWSIDTTFSVRSDGRKVRLGNAELEINTPRIGPLSFTGYIYNDALLNVELGVGGTFNLWRNLHISAEWERPNWGGAFANYAIRLGSRITLTPQVSFLFSEEGFEGLGGWIRADIDCGSGVVIRTQINHVRNLRDGTALNENAMVSVSFEL